MDDNQNDIIPNNDDSSDLDKKIVLNNVVEEGSRGLKETIIIIITIISLLTLSICSLVLFVFNVPTSKKTNNEKEDIKEEKKKDKKVEETVVYKSSVTEKAPNEIYDSLRNSTTKYSLNKIDGTTDDIVIETFKYLAAAYTSSSLISEDSKSYCSLLSSNELDDEPDKYMSLCLSNIEHKKIKEVLADGTSGNQIQIISESEMNKLLAYNNDISIPYIKDYCSLNNLKNEECDDTSIYVIPITDNNEKKDLENAIDIKSITKTKDKYKITLTKYTSNLENEIIVSDTIINVHIDDNHVVFD